MTRYARARKICRDAAARLGFRLLRLRPYLQRVPGVPLNVQWYEARLHCPCGRAKTLHLQHDSLSLLAGELRHHLIRDGLLP